MVVSKTLRGKKIKKLIISHNLWIVNYSILPHLPLLDKRTFKLGDAEK